MMLFTTSAAPSVRSMKFQNSAKQCDKSPIRSARRHPVMSNNVRPKVSAKASRIESEGPKTQRFDSSNMSINTDK